MAKRKKEKKTKLLGYDPVESPEEIIKKDSNLERRKAFLETYQRVAKIIPEYFMNQMKKKKNGSGASGGGTSFSQNIVVTPNKVTVQTHEVKEEQREEKERD